MIKTADRIIDMGPEGGEEGGLVMAQGTPEEVAATEGSHTGSFLHDLLPVATSAPGAQARRRQKSAARPKVSAAA